MPSSADYTRKGVFMGNLSTYVKAKRKGEGDLAFGQSESSVEPVWR